MTYWLPAALICMFFVGRDAAAQTSTRRKDTHRADTSITTRRGVYTAQQAARGRDIYFGNCRSCHTPESHTGATFTSTWNARSLAELYGFVRERMPKNDPGSLSDQEYADVLAYLLKLNKTPAGKSELPADSVAMQGIRIQLRKSPAR